MKRVLLKLSGEALANNSGEIYDVAFVDRVAASIVSCVNDGYEMAVVVASNALRLTSASGEYARFLTAERVISSPSYFTLTLLVRLLWRSLHADAPERSILASMVSSLSERR